MVLTVATLALLTAAAGGDDDGKALDEALRSFRASCTPRAGDDAWIAAINKVATHRHKRVAAALEPMLTRAKRPVRIAAARTLGTFHKIDGIPTALLKALKDGRNAGEINRGVRVEILRSLGTLQAHGAASEVNRRINDRDVWVAKASIDAAAKIRVKSSVDSLLQAFKRIEGPSGEEEISQDPLLGALPSTRIRDIIAREARSKSKPKTKREFLRESINQALMSITGEGFYTYKEWREWWNRHRSKFKVSR